MPFRWPWTEKLLHVTLEYFPIETSVRSPVFVMRAYESGDDLVILNLYRYLLKTSSEKDVFTDFEYLEWNDFYEHTKRCYCIAATGETELYANIII
jgi:L-fucose mutarotase